MKTINILLANLPVRSDNRGCEALAYSTLYLLDEFLTKNNLRYHFTLLNCGTTDGAHEISIGDRTIRFSAESGFLTKKFLLSSVFRLKFRELWRKIRLYRLADYILDIGQGDSFADIYGVERFREIDYIHRVARLFSKPYALLPQTIGPFELPSIEKKAAGSLENAALVMSRDRLSSSVLKELMPDKKYIECVDVAFFMPWKKQCFDALHTHVGLNVSALLWHGGYTRNNQFGLNVDYQSLTKNIIDYFLGMPNIKLHLVPHVVSSERVLENDYEVCYEIYRQYQHENLILSPLFFDPVVAKGYIAGLDFFIGARMHSTIAAFSSGVPVLPLAYSRKFNGLFTETLKYSAVGDMKALEADSLLAKIKESFSSRNQLKLDIQNANAALEEYRQILFKGLVDFFSVKNNFKQENGIR